MTERRTRLILILFCAATLELCRAAELCDSDPCQNGGVCVPTSLSDYVCQCMYGYAGDLCEIDIDFCASSPCLASGNCTDGVFSFSCECPAGFSGRHCEVDIDECEGEPCGESGRCIDGEGRYTCECDAGFTGLNCETNIDDCSPDPCVNGDCIDGVDGYVCECAPSFAGANCSIMTNCSAEEDTCQNNGVCNVTFDGGERRTSCVCLTGYTGDNCETDIDECSGNPCDNGGTCLDLLGRYSCVCPTDFTGETCSVEIDPCDPDLLPCENGAICRDGNCFCRNGFTGILCEINIDDCSSAPCLNGGVCIDEVAGFSCQCLEGFSGDFCNTSTSDACSLSPCLNGGTCSLLSVTEYACVCPLAFTGVNCSEMFDFCLSAPCQANTTAACISTAEGFECVCHPGYEGEVCESDVDACELLAPCENEGLCVDREGLNYSCECAEGYQGVDCREEIDECQSNPCQNNATCRDEVAGYRCLCPPGYTGSECEANINDCSPDPCVNGGTCQDQVAGYLCLCAPRFTGLNCSTEVEGCSNEPCGNGGTCVELGVADYICECAPGFTGDNCVMNIDDCAANPCDGEATCVDGIDSFSCVCPVGFTGVLCSELIDHCSPNPCVNGATCTSQLNGSSCSCPEGFTGGQCETQLCSLDCQNGGECVDNDRGSPTCSCSPGFTGVLCETQIHVCDTSPCAAHSTCLPLANDSFICLCSEGFTGASCEEEIDECEGEPCRDNGVCVDLVNGFECMCRNGFTGELCQMDIDDCSPNPCNYNSTCTDLVANYSCECAPGFEGRNCTIDIDLCDPLPCINGGSCSQNLTLGSVTCWCAPGYEGLFCQSDINECNTTSPPCLNGGECVNTRGGFHCVCPSGFSGPMCEEYNDCNGIFVCMNNATCVDIGNNFECICPLGYTGVICDIEISECGGDPCLNGGICRDEFLDFSCTCTEDYTGQVCDINLNPCSSSPCMNNGDCTNGEPGSEEFLCDCAAGFTGPLCEEDIDDCDSSPCPVGSTCLDSVNNFTCVCPPGFSGRLCDHNFIDNCAFPFCLNGGTCRDVGADYVCMCDVGFTGPNCEYGTNECLDNPCFNGGTCRDLFGGYECMCPVGFSGDACEIDIDDCLGVDCNNGTCVDMVDDFVCDCVPGYTGDRCETDFDECEAIECLFGGTCIDQINNFTCECVSGFEGRYCQVNIDDCMGIDCGNGTCEDLVDDYNCQCVVGYTGPACKVMIDECEQLPCMNDGSCVDRLNNFTCVCAQGFKGRFCEVNIDDCLNSTCLNGATCLDGINSYSCGCVFGYGGDDCGTVLDLCFPDTCSNNGTCTTTAPGVTQCSCSPLFTGAACEVYINLCLNSSRCANGGECVPTEVDGSPAFSCSCSTPYRGATCEIFDPCGGQPCLNNGSCVVDTSTESGYRCNCSSLFIGYNCLYPDLCQLSQPCSNGGTCINHTPAANDSSSEGTTSCVCGPGFTGHSCEVEITACYYQPCYNGGTCLLDPTAQLGYSCQCPLYWHGINCTQEINIVTPSFSGNSFLSHPLPSPSTLEFNYSLALLPTESSSGLILYLTPSQPHSHIGLGLEAAQLVLYVGTDSGSVELRTPVEANEWHAVELHVGSQQASLQVDSQTERVSFTRTSPVTEANTLVYVGGVPDFSLLLNVTQTVGLVGCVHDRAANGQSVELSVVAHQGRDVGQCSQSVCPYIQCQNGAQCSEVVEVPGFTCDCLPFFTGVFCETALPVCQPNPCLFGGLCREELSTFSCQCPLGRAGRTCEEDISITAPSFSGGSFIAYPPNSHISASVQTLSVSVTFSPATGSGLLFFTSTSETDFSDYFSLALVDGRVELRFNLGSGNFSVPSETELELNTWHVLTASLASGRGELTIDDEPTITGASQSLFTVLNTQNDIWLGGYTNFVDLTSIAGTGEGFSGCISALTIDSTSVDLILDSDYGYSVTQCNTSSCEAQPCMNGGSCLEEGPSFVCVCPPGLSGPLCSRVADRCGGEPDLCAEGATCVNSPDGLSFSCLCPIGREGQRCDEDVDIQTPMFNATSYLQFNPHSFHPPLSSVALRFNPSSPNGLLFYYGDHTHNIDFFSVALIRQRVEYRFELGSMMPGILISDPVDMDSWHYVVVTLDGTRGTMAVDGGAEVRGDSEGTLTVLNAAGDIFVGGVSDYGTVSPHAGTDVGLTGCISDLEINGVAVDLLGEAVGGRGISECSNDPCADLMCSNGGSCQVTHGSQTLCLCALGFAGPTCDTAIDIEVPSFTGESHLVHDSLVNVFATTSLTLEVRPSSPDGLLLFNKQADGVDYIAVLLRGGLVEFWYDLGSGPAIIPSREPLQLDEWHTIEVYRSGASGRLIVDNTLPVSGSSDGSLTGLQLGGPLFIGGVSDSASGNIPPLIRGVGGFGGCIRSIESNGAAILLISGVNYGAGVEECPLLPCTISPCLNNGVCFVESGNGSSGQQCLCSLPFTGTNCSQRVDGFMEARFSGQSYLQFSAAAVNIDQQRISTSVEISFTPTQLSGLLLYLGPTDASTSMDYLYITLSDGLVELRFDLGSGEVAVRTSQPLSLGQNHTVAVSRNGGNGVVSVSNGDSATTSLSEATNFDAVDSSFASYLGGAPSVASLTEGAYTSGISGCVTQVRIGRVGSSQHLQISTATSGQAVDTCS